MAKKVRDQADANGLAVGAGKKDGPRNAAARQGADEVFSRAESSMPGDRESGTGLRQTIGLTAFTPKTYPQENPRLLVKKKGHAKGGGDPSMGTATSRGGVTQRDRLGPRYSTAVTRPQSIPVAPESAATQANGRVIRSAVRRDRANFSTGLYENLP